MRGSASRTAARAALARSATIDPARIITSAARASAPAHRREDASRSRGRWIDRRRRHHHPRFSTVGEAFLVAAHAEVLRRAGAEVPANLAQLLAVGAFAAVQRCFTAGEGAMMALMSALLVVDAAVVTSCTVADIGPALCVARGEAATASEAVACGGLLLALLLLALCGPPRPAAARLSPLSPPRPALAHLARLLLGPPWPTFAHLARLGPPGPAGWLSPPRKAI